MNRKQFELEERRPQLETQREVTDADEFARQKSAGPRNTSINVGIDQAGVDKAWAPQPDEKYAPGEVRTGEPSKDVFAMYVGAAAAKPITTGDVLERVAEARGEMPVTPSDANAIRAAQIRSQGRPLERGSIAAQAQSAAAQNLRTGAVAPTAKGWAVLNVESEGTKLKNVLQDAREINMPTLDKPISTDDATEMRSAEERVDPTGRQERASVGAHATAAARENLEVAKAKGQD